MAAAAEEGRGLSSTLANLGIRAAEPEPEPGPGPELELELELGLTIILGGTGALARARAARAARISDLAVEALLPLVLLLPPPSPLTLVQLPLLDPPRATMSRGAVRGEPEEAPAFFSCLLTPRERIVIGVETDAAADESNGAATVALLIDLFVCGESMTPKQAKRSEDLLLSLFMICMQRICKYT